jgi:hypothetical protein
MEDMSEATFEHPGAQHEAQARVAKTTQSVRSEPYANPWRITGELRLREVSHFDAKRPLLRCASVREFLQ